MAAQRRQRPRFQLFTPELKSEAVDLAEPPEGFASREWRHCVAGMAGAGHLP